MQVLATSGSLLALAAASIASAQPMAPPVATTPAVVEQAKSYTPADFARFAPRTALDMVRQVPGFIIEESDEERRGLGQATGNVLINGERPSGKSNDAIAELGRIPATNVTRIDIVDGATLDVPGLTGQVANVIATAGGISGNFAWRPQQRAERTPLRWSNGEISLSGADGRFAWSASLVNDSRRNGNAGPEIVSRPDGTIIDRRDEVLGIKEEAPKLSGSMKYQTRDGAIANLTGSLQFFDLDLFETSLRRGPDQPDRDRLLTEREREWNYELGGDFEFALGGGRMKLIGIRRYEHSPYVQTVTVDFADGSPRTGDRFTQTADEGETILRSEYRWKAGGADWQLAAEGALNTLGVTSGLEAIGPEGTFVPAPLPDATSDVEEKRAELTLSYGRPLAPTLTLQSSLGGEYSRLSQSGPAGQTREFWRPKGFVSLAWKPSPRLDLSAKLERVVGQLDFFDFVASANVSAGTSNAGNPDLRPQQSWEATLEASRSFGAWGNATAKVYGKRITDIVDIVPIGADGQAPGNLESADVYGASVTGTLNFDPVGVPGAKVDLELLLQDSGLDDPLTGVRRAINELETRRIIMNYRHDLPATPWAYGVNFEQYRQAAGFRLDQRFRFIDTPGSLGLFVEHKDVAGLTVRGAIDNLLDTNESFSRSFYDDRRTNPLLFTEDRDRFYGPVFTLTITGTI